jgi:ribosomal protein S18 acetylase RimI-like enzyme
LEAQLFCCSNWEAVWNLHAIGLQQVGAYREEAHWYDDLHSIEDVYLNNGGEFLVGLLDGQIMAMGALKRTDQERAEIKRMRVHPTVQGSGFGTMMLQELERRAHALGCRVLHLNTATILLAAQHLYRKQGFRETGETQTIGNLTDILFEKQLS